MRWPGKALPRSVAIASAPLLVACSSGGSSAQSSGAGGAPTSSSSSGGSSPVAPLSLPIVQSLGGPVLKAPKVQPIAYQSDTGLADIESFLTEMTKTTYWSETTSEYGVGALTILPTIVLDTAPPTSPTDGELKTSLATNTSGASPAWGAVDASTIYLFVMPEGSLVQASGTACTDFDGYHAETTVNGVSVAYAVSSACPGFDGPSITLLQERTVNISHELIESATDPLWASNPAYAQDDTADFFWAVATGGEVADMCELNEDAYYVPPDGTYMVQRSWSNAAAKEMKNPCVPRAAGDVYFNSFPAFETVMWIDEGQPAVATRGFVIPVGQSKTVDLDLYSASPTSGPWTVSAYDYDALLYGKPANLDFSFDKTTGVSGDTLHLTIKSVSEDTTLGGGGFVLYSDLGKPGDADFAETVVMGIVVP